MSRRPAWACNEDAERAVLGCAMVDSDSLPDILAEVDEDDFFISKNKHIFNAIKSLSSKSVSPDYLTVTDELSSTGKLSLAGGMSYVTSLTDGVPHLNMGPTYAKVVRERAIARRYVEELERGVDEIKHGRAEVYTIADKVLHASIDSSRDEVATTKEILGDIITEIEDIQAGVRDGYLSTGFSNLDKYAPTETELCIIAARPSVGKTMLAVNVLENIAKRDQSVLLCSAEMSTQAIMKRRAAQISGVSMDKMKRRGAMSTEDWNNVVSSFALLEKRPFFIDDRTDTISKTLASIKKHHARHGIVAVAIDYLQLLRPSKDYGSTNDNVGEMCHRIKGIAKELSIVVFLLSQLSRANEKEGRRPRLDDLRSSGDIEQDADIVWFPYDSSKPNVIEIICAKNRNGPKGVTELQVRKRIGRMW